MTDIAHRTRALSPAVPPSTPRATAHRRHRVHGPYALRSARGRAVRWWWEGQHDHAAERALEQVMAAALLAHNHVERYSAVTAQAGTRTCGMRRQHDGAVCKWQRPECPSRRLESYSHSGSGMAGGEYPRACACCAPSTAKRWRWRWHGRRRVPCRRPTGKGGAWPLTQRGLRRKSRTCRLPVGPAARGRSLDRTVRRSASPYVRQAKTTFSALHRTRGLLSEIGIFNRCRMGLRHRAGCTKTEAGG